MNHTYDMVIIGGGSAGLTAAGFANQLGQRVALVEKNHLGGDCTWYGCVPSKTLLKTAQVGHDMRHGHRYGLSSMKPQVDLKAVMDHVNAVVNQVYQPESPEALREQGIDVFAGEAQFLDSHKIAVGDDTLTARRVLISTGASPFIPPIDGIASVNYLTYENIWGLQTLPEHLMVIGGGPIGCELSQAFCRLGSRVTVVEGLPRILPQDEPEVSEVLSESFADEGIQLRTNAMVQRVWQDDKGIRVVTADGDLMGDALLLAVGRKPNVGTMALDNAGVTHGPQGIMVNANLRTSQKHIYAAGDCIGGYQFTHYAGWQGFMAVRNALLPGNKKAVLDRVPSATFTDPEVAHVGFSEEAAWERFGSAVQTYAWPLEQVDRAMTDGSTQGFIKVVYKRSGRLLGATIVGGRASEMIHEWILAIDQGLKISDLANSIHVYPTYSMGSMQVASRITVAQLLGGISGRIIRRVTRLMR